MSVAAVLFLAAHLAQADADFDAFFADFAARRNRIRVLEARFTQETVTPDETIASTGTLVYVKPKRLIFRYEDPELVYIIDGLMTYEYDAELEQLQIFEIEDRPETEALFLGFDDSTDRLREAYDIEILPPEEGGDGKAIRLKPKTRDSDTVYFQFVTLELRAEDYLPTRIYIQNDEDSHVLIRVSDFAVNRALEAEDTQIFLPEGTDIVNNERYVETVGPEGKRVPPPMDPADVTETPLEGPAGETGEEDAGAP